MSYTETRQILLANFSSIQDRLAAADRAESHDIAALKAAMAARSPVANCRLPVLIQG